MAAREVSAPLNSHSYTSSAVPSAASIPGASMSGASTLANPREPVPVVGPDNAPVMYFDVRKSPSKRPKDVLLHSPRNASSMSVGSADAPPPILPPNGDRVVATLMKLSAANEQTWLTIGSAAETMGDTSRALGAYESALLHNPYSVPALSAMASVYRSMDLFDLAVEYFQRVLDIDGENGEVWGAMGHCYLMMDELEKAYSSYHRALYHLPNPKEPKLWYGIGILYDRYGSLEHAEETFSSVVRMNPDYEKANEIYFRLGIIYKQQRQYESSLECFRFILNNPPKPLTEMDIWFQIGHVHEQQHAYDLAKKAYEHVLSENQDHAKVLQQLGLLYMQPDSGFFNQEKALEYFHRSLSSDSNDPQTWYFVGRSYMDIQEFNKAYDAYQQAVYRDGKNPALWCSIGILYFQITQFHDSLGAFSRSIRLNPYIPEIWLNLGILYETCNNQISDAIDAYRRALELEPDNTVIQQRLQLLQNAEPLGKAVPNIPQPKDVPLDAYATAAPASYVSPPGNSVDPDEAAWSRSGAPTGASVGSEAPFVREIPAEENRKHMMEPTPHSAYDTTSRSYGGMTGYGGSYGDYDRSNASHHSRMYDSPSEWDRQASMPYADDRGMAYASRVPSSSRPSVYDGRGSRYDSTYQGGSSNSVSGADLDGHGARPYLPVSGASQIPLNRSRHLSPGRERERADSEHDGMIHHRSRDAPTLRGMVHTHASSSDTHSGRSRDADRSSRASMPADDTREVDEDYDEGAASALMGLAGAVASTYETGSWSRARAEPSAVRSRSPLPAKRISETDWLGADAKRRRNDDTYSNDERVELSDARSPAASKDS